MGYHSNERLLKTMSRPKKKRVISKKISSVYFKPRGVALSSLEEVVLTFEQVEALRLADFKGLKQTESAKKMNISRPTFQRILSSARLKVANALTNGKAIKIEGGEFVMRNQGRGRGFRRGRGGGGFSAGPGGKCICTNPDCGYSAVHVAGISCYQQKCPKCGSPMTREIKQ